MRMKKIIIFFFLLSLISLNLISAMQDPAKAYCQAMGYEYVLQKTAIGDVGYCRFNSLESCLASRFLIGECGEEYSYCLKNNYKIAIVYGKEICSSVDSSRCAVCVLEDGKKIEITKLMDLKNYGEVNSIWDNGFLLIILVLMIIVILIIIIFLGKKLGFINSKITIWIIVGVIVILLLIVFIYLLSIFLAKDKITAGGGIEKAVIEDGKLQATVKGLYENENISEVKFIIKDKNDKSYSAFTNRLSESYEFEPGEFGLDKFKDIKKVYIIIYYEEPEEIENPKSDAECAKDSDCNDGINCTRNICNNGVCDFVREDSICNDGNYCNGIEYCDLNRGCVSGAGIDCSYLDDICNEGICYEQNQSCTKIPVLDVKLCDDNANCTVNDICMNGTCIGTPDNTKCNDNIACTNDICFNKNCSHLPNDFACSSSYKCDIFLGCVQNSCLGCDDCNNFYSDCDYTKCHTNCRKTEDCYFKGGLASCINKTYACSQLIRNCSDYSLQECANDPCNLDCKLENEACIKEYDCSLMTCSNFSASQCIVNPCGLNCSLESGLCTQIRIKIINITEVEPAFRSYDELINLLKEWEREAGDIVDVGIYGKTTKQIDQYYIKITNEKITSNKPKSLVTGAIHGNEMESTWTVMWWISHILNSYGKDSQVTDLVDTRELYFIPSVSPDTYNKARYVDGVDPNRNFPASGEKQSVTPVENLKIFILNRSMDSFISGHTYGRVYIWNYNQDATKKAAYERITSQMVALSTGYSRKMYTQDSTLDYNWGDRNGVCSIVIEFGTHQRAPTVAEIKGEFDRTYKAGLYFMKEAPVAW